MERTDAVSPVQNSLVQLRGQPAGAAAVQVNRVAGLAHAEGRDARRPLATELDVEAAAAGGIEVMGVRLIGGVEDQAAGAAGRGAPTEPLGE
jgi:hypothetical protein